MQRGLKNNETQSEKPFFFQCLMKWKTDRSSNHQSSTEKNWVE